MCADVAGPPVPVGVLAADVDQPPQPICNTVAARLKIAALVVTKVARFICEVRRPGGEIVQHCKPPSSLVLNPISRNIKRRPLLR